MYIGNRVRKTHLQEFFGGGLSDYTSGEAKPEMIDIDTRRRCDQE